MFFEGKCSKCGSVVEYMSSKKDRDSSRTHSSEDAASTCDGELKRVPYPRKFAVRWKYGVNDKVGCFMGPSNNKYKTDTTMKRDRSKTRTVTGPHYSGSTFKDTK